MSDPPQKSGSRIRDSSCADSSIVAIAASSIVPHALITNAFDICAKARESTETRSRIGETVRADGPRGQESVLDCCNRFPNMMCAKVTHGFSGRKSQRSYGDQYTGECPQIRMVNGFSMRRTKAAIHAAATAPSMTR
jgi:hypothetical protein